MYSASKSEDALLGAGRGRAGSLTAACAWSPFVPYVGAHFHPSGLSRVTSLNFRIKLSTYLIQASVEKRSPQPELHFLRCADTERALEGQWAAKEDVEPDSPDRGGAEGWRQNTAKAWHVVISP